MRCALTTCKIAESKWHQCSPQHTQGMSAQQAFSTDYPLMWEWEECNSFDVANGSTQISTSCYALKFARGEQWMWPVTQSHNHMLVCVNVISLHISQLKTALTA